MRKLYCTKDNQYGILDESNDRVYWINEDLSPIWSNYIHGQKSMMFENIKEDLEFIYKLDFDYFHVTNILENASLD